MRQALWGISSCCCGHHQHCQANPVGHVSVDGKMSEIAGVDREKPPLHYGSGQLVVELSLSGVAPDLEEGLILGGPQLHCGRRQRRSQACLRRGFLSLLICRNLVLDRC